MSEVYSYDEKTGEFELDGPDSGNRVIVEEHHESTPDLEPGIMRYKVEVDDFGFVIAAMIRLFDRLGICWE